MRINPLRSRPLAIGPLRAFEAVARLSSFRAAGDELFLTQSAISRQIRALEDELGAPLFNRGTRHVELTAAGHTLLRALAPLLARLDGTVRQIRSARARQRVSLSTLASFASLWLLPRLQDFQRRHLDIDIRISASDNLVDLDDAELDLVIRHCRDGTAPAGARKLFGEVVTPAIGTALQALAARGEAPPLLQPDDLAGHTLLEEDDHHPASAFLSWRHWLQQHGLPGLEPARWLYLNFTYQQVQAALAGQGVTLARVGLVADALQRGELVEPFGPGMRVPVPWAYWVAPTTEGAHRPEVQRFVDWVCEQAAQTRLATGEA
ncbi:LysR family transcriptional regulator [Aquabacterium sp. J223]|uniref:LysR family transcriptional regulator n=1 Tax=Aquabacterium sp. J223 TaxID=2898431 RepID=UPI0021ADCFC3|nr:LysR family transcriptional regulator [Aquabacterium sp. J223]UUX96471.1 LysR substrate-binding domain-containing protein [Aquabacterium sp. J223]